jgi:hypothetical protein
LNGLWLPNNRNYLGQDVYYLPGTEHLLSVEQKTNDAGELKTRAHIETYPPNIPGYSKGWHEGFRETYGDGNFAPTMTILPVRLRVEEVEDEEKGDS